MKSPAPACSGVVWETLVTWQGSDHTLRQLVSFKSPSGLAYRWDLRLPSGEWDALRKGLSTPLTHWSPTRISSFVATFSQRFLAGNADPSGISLTPRTGCHNGQFSE